MKNIVVIIRSTPLNDVRSLEGIRMGTGLTFYGDRVTIIFIGDGIWSATRPDKGINLTSIEKEWKKNIDVFLKIGGSIIVDRESVNVRGAKNIITGAEIKDRTDVVNTISSADVVIPF